VEHFAAVDLGATSGRVAVGSVSDGSINFEVLHRFPNHIVQSASGAFLWDIPALFEEVLKGLRLAASQYKLRSVAVDTWAVDYLLYDSKWQPIAPSYSYRDSRTDGVMEDLISSFGRSKIYERTGIAFLPFNTIYQLKAAQRNAELNEDARFLMLPDVFNNLLCGSHSNEITNASSTQLLDANTRQWDWDLIDLIGLPRSTFPALHEAGVTLGSISKHEELCGIDVVAIGSHDTASAVAAAPMSDPDHTIYISSGTWSLVGCEVDEPVITQETLELNLTNELGVRGKVRLLKNVAGMWILSQLLAEWQAEGTIVNIADLVREAESHKTNARINSNDPIFLAPGPMVERVKADSFAYSGVIPSDRGELARCVYESLAESYAKTIVELEKATGKTFTSINVVGGGSANDFLNQLTANATGLRVISGPVEATLLGNIGLQAMRTGAIRDLAHLRELVSNSYDLKTYTSV
jgi:rhamnulokinase